MRRRARPPVMVVLAACVVVAVVVCAILTQAIAPDSASQPNLVTGVQTPSSAHWLGTDQLGRDVLSRLIVGARSALIGPIIVAVGALLIGNAFGLAAGYLGGSVDAVIMRCADVMYALPPLLIALVASGVLGGGYVAAIIVLTLLFAPYDARLVRGATLAVRRLPYVEAAQILGVSRVRVMLFEIWPNVAGIAIANFFINFAYALVALVSLSYLGLGVPPGTPDWGSMLSDAEGLLFSNPASAIAPAVMIILTAASMSILGDVLYERVVDRGKVRL